MFGRKSEPDAPTLPTAGQPKVATVGPHDVIVIEAPEHLGQKRADALAKVIHEIWPGRKVLILDGGQTMQVMREE